MRPFNPFATLIFFVIIAAGGLFAMAVGIVSSVVGTGIAILTVIVATVVSSAIKVADQWNRAVVLRLGRFHDLKGPGLS